MPSGAERPGESCRRAVEEGGWDDGMGTWGDPDSAELASTKRDAIRPIVESDG